MKIGFQLWGQFVNWPDLLAAAQTVERLGFDSLWSNDHFYPAAGGPDGPVLEGWMTLAAWAAATERIPLGCLVSGAGYRNPGLLVKMATTLDHVSGGRAILGLGAGWHEREHRAFGFRLPSVGQRLVRLDEAAAIVRGLLDGETLTFAGSWYHTDAARNDPAPLQARLPLLIGGSGERKTLRTVARFADAWNGEGDADTIRHKSSVLDEHCRAAGRDPSRIRRTVGLPPPSIRADREEALESLVAILRRHRFSAEEARQVAATAPCVGTPETAQAVIEGYAAIGIDELVFDLPAPFDLRTLESLARLRRG